MKVHKGAPALVLVALAVLWALANRSALSAGSFAQWRGPGLQLTGGLAIGAVCIGALLALRSRVPERALGGLDKVYRSHRYFGIAAVVFGVLHWALVQSPKWIGGGGEHARGGARHAPASTSGLAHALQAQHGLAASLGNWGFYSLVVLAIVALVTRIPYRLFYYSHRLLAIVLLLLAFHTLVFFPYAQWPTAIGVVLALLLVGGVATAFVSLFGRVGVHRRAHGKAASYRYYDDLQILQAEVEMDANWRGHKPGQFAFVEGGRWEGQHPFTIASAWHPDERRITFVTKELGDFTSALKDRVRHGAPVEIEGPYGSFTFEDSRPLQIWIAGGVGITPFVAMLRHRQRESVEGEPAVHLFFTSEDRHEEGLGKLSDLAHAARVHCHYLHTPRDGFLTGERVREDVPEWREASVWFCGPAAFGEAIRSDFLRHGMKPRRYHQELFAWR